MLKMLILRSASDFLFPAVPKSYLSLKENYLLGLLGGNDDVCLNVDEYHATDYVIMKGLEWFLSRDNVSLGSKSRDIIKVGKRFDFVSKLSKRSRNSLRRVDGTEVNCDSLEGKYILVCCVLVPCLWVDSVVRAISLASCEIYSKKINFEVVLVPQLRGVIPRNYDQKDTVEYSFSGFPASCIVASQEYNNLRYDAIGNLLRGSKGSSKFVLLHPNGKALMYKNVDYFLSFDIDNFPPSRKNKRRLDVAANGEEQQRLEDILGCDVSEFLSRIIPGSVEEEKVSVSQLTKKLVGLYVCTSGRLLGMLQKIGRACREGGKDFEIVLICAPFYCGVNPEEIRGLIIRVLQKCNLSWLVAPFKNSVSRRLQRISGSQDDAVIIVGPDGHYMNPNGGAIMENAGISAYPFMA